ncbi:MAG: MotA/TolQ/ExbB proton channel family protein [Bernardetiaceae bacterium]|jgi:biopolymer transport protein ExbB|nr:MotA/TolQ/ExbB proton channel family protein [Bernardetiaceae bacterium]
MILFQIDTTALGSAASSQVTLTDLVLAGGWTMIPLALLGILAIYIIAERLLNIRKAGAAPAQLFNEVKSAVLEGSLEKAKGICAREDSPISRMLEKGISKLGRDIKQIEASIENAGKIEVYKLEKNLGLLATIAGAAPMVGFYGTVTGMISAFIAIAQEEGSVSPKLLSSGIYEAMITTAAGLIIGIIAYIGYNYLVTQVQKVTYNMELTTIEFLDLLEKPH